MTDTTHDKPAGPNKEDRILGALSYFPGGFILPYLLGLGHHPFVLFHLKQGFFLFSLYVIAWILPIPGVGTFAALPYLILVVLHAYKAYNWVLYGFSWMSWLHASTDPLSEAAKLSPKTPPKN